MCFLQIISAADEVVTSIDRDELAKYCALKSDPEDEAAEVSVYLFAFILAHIQLKQKYLVVISVNIVCASFLFFL